ncbi:MAG: alginate O-acetyltransferase AlgX-related protein [Isosphaeraceae bacterium]
MRNDRPSQKPRIASGSGPAPLQTRGLRRPSEIYRKVEVEPMAPPKWKDIALIVVFLGSIALPMLGLVFRLDMGVTLEENRVMAPRPELKLDRQALAEFPGKFETYFNEQFGFRQRLIHWLNLAKVAILRVSPSSKVILGKNGWLFYGEIDVPYYRALEPLTTEQLEDWRRVFESRRDWLAARGIPYLLAIAPHKGTIYPEYLPSSYNRVHAESRLDQLMAHLKAHASLAVLDLRGPLFEAKAREQVYYRTDTHWNNRGAYVAYTKIMEAVSAWYPELKATPRSAFREIRYSEQGRDLSMLLGLRKYFWDEYNDLEFPRPRLAKPVADRPELEEAPGRFVRRGHDFIFEHPDQRLPRAVVFRDSFATWLMPLLSEHFRRVTFSWQNTFERRLVEREYPDIVIQEILERFLMESPYEYLTEASR